MFFKKRDRKITFSDPVIAFDDKFIPVVEMDMLSMETKEPVKVRLENVAWHLVEVAGKNGSKYRYIVGLPNEKGSREE